uniref:Uncharacterized protein n=1 Tax=Anguilla anguilla TaxID=7936 RepID=A0A0E9UUY6_ANGAN
MSNHGSWSILYCSTPTSFRASTSTKQLFHSPKTPIQLRAPFHAWPIRAMC